MRGYSEEMPVGVLSEEMPGSVRRVSGGCEELQQQNRELQARVRELEGQLRAPREHERRASSGECSAAGAPDEGSSEKAAKEAQQEAKGLRIKLRLAELKLQSFQAAATGA